VVAIATDGEAQSRPKAGSRTVASSCTFSIAESLDFGAYDDDSVTSAYSTATFNLKCTRAGTTAVVSAGPSTTTGSMSDRRLDGPGDSVLRYQVYTNASRTVIWGDGSQDTQQMSVPQSGSSWSFTVYAEVFPHQVGEVGAYTDSLVITVTP
jgi:spore coat protein U-like protein